MAKKRKIITKRKMKWIALVLCATAAATAAYSMTIERVSRGQGTNIYRSGAYMDSGSVQLHWVRVEKGHVGSTKVHHWTSRRDWSALFVPRLRRYQLAFSFPPGESWLAVDIRVPLGTLALLLAAPAAWLFYSDRRAKPWQCDNCRYDLRGLESGVCPECGAHRRNETEPRAV